jgi:DNA-binding transcriptional LysR family regulator
MFSAPVVFDLAIRVGPLADSTLTARKLGELHYGLFAAPGYLARYGAPTEPSELQTHDTLVFSGGQSSRYVGVVARQATEINYP